MRENYEADGCFSNARLRRNPRPITCWMRLQVPASTSHMYQKYGMRGHKPPRCIGAICDQKNAQRKQQCHVASYFASAMASTAACRTTLNFAPTRALGVPDCACASASRTRALATCAASWAPPNPHVAAICRKSATKAPKRDDAATTRLALLDALPATRGSYSPTATLH